MRGTKIFDTFALQLPLLAISPFLAGSSINDSLPSFSNNFIKFVCWFPYIYPPSLFLVSLIILKHRNGAIDDCMSIQQTRNDLITYLISISKIKTSFIVYTNDCSIYDNNFYETLLKSKN